MSMAKHLALLATLLSSAFSQAANYQSHSTQGQSLNIATDEFQVQIRFHHQDAIEVVYDMDSLKSFPSFATGTDAQKVTVNLTDKDDFLTFGSENLYAKVSKAPFAIEFIHDGETITADKQGLDTTQGVSFHFQLDDTEKLMGTGQRVLGMDRRGHKLPLYNKAHYGYETESSQMYFGVSAVMSSDKYMVLFDNSASGEVDLGATEANTLSFGAVGGRAAYWVIAGNTYPDLIKNYVDVTGKQPLPPRWALGNFASRFGYRTQAEVMDVVAKFKRDEIPLDAIILDLYWFGKTIKGTMGNLAWDAESFPDPEGMIADLRKQGVKTIVITEPFILTSSLHWDEAVDKGVLALDAAGEPKRFDFYFGNTGIIDIFNTQANDWFWTIYQGLKRQGIAGWWGDLGEPEVHPDDTIHAIGRGDELHNAYGHAWAEMLFTRLKKAYPNERPMIMMRSGFAGSQRYGMIPWTGDVNRSWGGLKPQVELALQMSLLGLAYTHSDLGGFAGGETFDAELYTRWLQYGAFQPVYRPHAQEHIPSEPVFHDEQTKARVKKFIDLRYQMLPYNYSLAIENSLTGMPLMRPMFFNDESDTSLIANSTSYFWGEDLLVTPVTEPGLEAVSIDLPKGTWFDFWTSKKVSGGQTISYATDMDSLPVLVKAGAIIPMVDVVETTDNYRTDELTLHVYPDESVAQSSRKIYNDDGSDANSLSAGRFETMTFEQAQTDTGLSISLQHQGQYDGMPNQRRMTLVVHNAKRPQQVLANASVTEFSYNEEKQQLMIVLDWNHQDLILTVE